jgi:MYXO-CTERM domain-containing protein
MRREHTTGGGAGTSGGAGGAAGLANGTLGGGGCDCRTAGGGASGSALSILLALGLLARRRRIV